VCSSDLPEITEINDPRLEPRGDGMDVPEEWVERRDAILGAKTEGGGLRAEDRKAPDGAPAEITGAVSHSRDEEVIRKIIDWYWTGKGLREGDSFNTRIDLGSTKSLIRGGKKAKFYFCIPGSKGRYADVIFIAENDPVHGFVLNCYYADQVKFLDRKFMPALARPIAMFKFIPAAGRVRKIDPARMDIVYAFFGLRKIDARPRAFRAKVYKDGYVSIRIPEEFPVEEYASLGLAKGEAINLKIPTRTAQDKELAGKEVYVLVEDDINQGQVINVYLAGDRDAGKKTGPLVTYKFYDGVQVKGARHVQAIQVQLAELDILDAYEGRELKLLKRAATLWQPAAPSAT
jgi:hypothetical protein